MNSKLHKFSTAELEQELKRRELNIPHLIPLEELSIEPLIEYIEDEGIERLIKGKGLRKHFHEKLLKILIELLYGNEGWNWWALNDER